MSGSHEQPEFVLRLDEVGYAYRDHEDRPVLLGISLAVRRGEFVVIAGRTGSGKTTLCQTLCGIIPSNIGGTLTGSVRVAGVVTTDVEVAVLARSVGMVQQNPESQIVGLTVAEDVEFGLENLALPIPEIAERASSAITTVGLAGLEERSPWRLSGGQKQRLAIAASLAFAPAVLVLDNPVGELDPVGRAEVYRTIDLLHRERGVTIVMVCQDLSEVVGYADRILLLDEGRVVACGDVPTILGDAGLLRSAGVRVPDLVELAERLAAAGRPVSGSVLTVEDAAATLTRAGIALAARPAGPPAAPPGRPPARPIVEFDEVRFGYPGGPEVLRGLNLTIGAGEFVAVMGANGSGKSTLGKQLNGLLRPSSGEVRIDGVPTRGLRISQLAATVGYVFQNPDHQIVAGTVAEEFALGPRNLGWDAARIQAAVAHALEFIGMPGRGDADPFMLGLAERNLVALATALIVEPKILVLDEPATGADFAVIQRLLRRVAELHAAGMTVLMVTHDAGIVAQYAQRLVVVAEGAVRLDGPPGEVFGRVPELAAARIVPPPIPLLATRLDPTAGVSGTAAVTVEGIMAALATGTTSARPADVGVVGRHA